VTDIHDPKKLGRVKVLLPACENNETDWMNVLLPAAGQGKGLVMLPDKGDQVLVVFLNNDPARGVVLGGIYGASKHPPDWGIEGGKVQRYTVMTPGGQHIMLDDHTQAVRVENKHGSYVELTPKKVRLHSEADIEIEAPGNNVTIRGRRVDFKKG
jgi:phage baseplate assembly protein V